MMYMSTGALQLPPLAPLVPLVPPLAPLAPLDPPKLLEPPLVPLVPLEPPLDPKSESLPLDPHARATARQETPEARRRARADMS
jgi:hypothetical protein